MTEDMTHDEAVDGFADAAATAADGLTTVSRGDYARLLGLGFAGIISSNLAIVEAIRAQTEAIEELTRETCRTGPNHYDS